MREQPSTKRTIREKCTTSVLQAVRKLSKQIHKNTSNNSPTFKSFLEFPTVFERMEKPAGYFGDYITIKRRK